MKSSLTIQSMLEELQVPFDDLMVHQLEQYYQMVIDSNKRQNLTGITECEDFIRKHYQDSLSLWIARKELGEEQIDLTSASLIDVGTGAGFPGIPLKIIFPELKVTLLDSSKKRIEFLNKSITGLGLKKIDAIHMRAEDAARKETLREQFDLVVARAVKPLPILLEYCLPFAKVGGMFVSYKGPDVEEEVSLARPAIEELSGAFLCNVKFSLLKNEDRRTFVLIKKTKPMAKEYPRRAGVPEKRPII